MNRQMIWLGIPLILGLGCDESTAGVEARCEIEVVQPEDRWSRGETVILQGYPFSSVIDTTVLINDITIEVANVNTSTDSCVECSSCREAEFCTTCGFCEACTVDCAECLHELEFAIPETIPVLPEYSITIMNGFGSSSSTAIEIVDTDVTE